MKTKTIILIGIALIIGFLILYPFNTQSCEEVPAQDINLKAHKNMVMHIHPVIKISINDEFYLIPANIGISQTSMKAIHTHDETGTLHIESPCLRDFTLKDFFTIWEKNFDNECIFDYCNDETSVLNVYSNNQKVDNPEALVFEDNQLIEIIYK